MTVVFHGKYSGTTIPRVWAHSVREVEILGETAPQAKKKYFL